MVHEPDLWDLLAQGEGLPGMHWKGETNTVAFFHCQCPCSAPEAKEGKQRPRMLPPNPGTDWVLPQSQTHKIKCDPSAPEPMSANIYGSLIWFYLAGNFLFLES